MRLLHARDFTFQEFFDEERPPYAILSHRWTKEEVTYKQYVERTYIQGAGIEKVRQTCTHAVRQSLDWVWIDTICIDKSSSAELSEAVNSMWNWYANAAICLAYLADVKSSENSGDVSQDFCESEWFDRGWTLQELLAPQNVLFLDARWNVIGYRSYDKMIQRRGREEYDLEFNYSWQYRGIDSQEFMKQTDLSALISKTTGIGREFLMREISFSEASVAMKMSWAAKRVTTRTEDQAYCLLGLFGVNMPLLYGEGRNAFFRLQLEILRNSDDESIFAWRADRPLHGLLAESVRDFAGAANVYKMNLSPEQRLPWSWTNKGLELRILDRTGSSNHDPMPPGNLEQVVCLGCFIKDHLSNEHDIKSPWLQSVQAEGQKESYIAISIRRFGNAWYRMRCNGFYLDAGFQSMSRSLKASLIYKYYYVPRHPSLEAWVEFEQWQSKVRKMDRPV